MYLPAHHHTVRRVVIRDEYERAFALGIGDRRRGAARTECPIVTQSDLRVRRQLGRIGSRERHYD
jgi:hypothetical protein